MTDKHKEKKFIKLPQYPGGKEAFQEFIKKNMRYPAEARQKGIEGTVHVKYRVDGLGRVVSSEVTHGLGHGCDEEAVRLVNLLRYGKAKNRGMRVTATMRTRINFKLPKKQEIQFEYKSTKKQTQKSTSPEKKDSGYGYTISF